MDNSERTRIEEMQKRLPLNQQQLVNVQVTNYRQSLITKGIPKPNIDAACMVFWKTIVTKLYGASPPPPPPTAKRTPGAGHPLALPVKRPPVINFVDKSNGLLSKLLPGSSLPVGLQDWVNRVYLVMGSTGNSVMRKKVDDFISDTVRLLTQNGDLWKTNWISYAVPSLSQLGSYVAGTGKLTREPDVIDLEPPPKKVHKVVEEFIPIRTSIGRKQPSLDAEEIKRRNQRAMKYRDHLNTGNLGSATASPEVGLNVSYEFGNDEEDVFEKTGHYSVVGTCKTMEKRYLRLTSAPDPALVRPESVLRKWLSELERLWSTKQKDWKFIEDQMRAVRQDLTVQNLRGEFTGTVYELNARWALEGGDLGQFNQCQTQLRQLHDSMTVPDDIRIEFLAYRLLYYTFQNLRVDEQIFLNKVLADRHIRDHPFMKFALQVRSAAVTSNFSLYFKLSREARKKKQKIAPSHAHFLMHAFENRQRMLALVVITKAIATPVTVAWLTDMLGFDSEEEAYSFLSEHNAVMKNESCLDPKGSYPVFSESPLLVGSKLKLMG
jgi:hypothetical protein